MSYYIHTVLVEEYFERERNRIGTVVCYENIGVDDIEIEAIH